jgi:hypothetical protein
MGMRIEFTQRYLKEEDRVLYEDQLNMPVPESSYKYRRIYPLLLEVAYPMEIPGDKEHCEILFRDDVVITVKGSFCDIALLIDDREKQDMGDEF